MRDWGAATGSARLPAPPGLGGRLQRGCVSAPSARAESASSANKQSQVRAGARAGRTRSGDLQCAPYLRASVGGSAALGWGKGRLDPKLGAGRVRRAGRGLRRITGRPGSVCS